jgi:lipoprotein-releasing system permease protein
VAIELALRATGDRRFQDLGVYTWEQLRKNLLSAVKIEKFIIYFLMCLLVAFTACMVLLMLVLTVIEKTRDVGVLMSLGATPRGVVKVFLTNGMILSFVGTLMGLGLGYLFCAFINPIHDWIYSVTGLRLFPAEIYHMDRIPVAFQPLDVLLSIGPPLVLCFLASLVPAVWASRRDPIKAIHHE